MKKQKTAATPQGSNSAGNATPQPTGKVTVTHPSGNVTITRCVIKKTKTPMGYEALSLEPVATPQAKATPQDYGAAYREKNRQKERDRVKAYYEANKAKVLARQVALDAERKRKSEEYDALVTWLDTQGEPNDYNGDPNDYNLCQRVQLLMRKIK